MAEEKKEPWSNSSPERAAQFISLTGSSYSCPFDGPSDGRP
jgi:hypothetical protein